MRRSNSISSSCGALSGARIISFPNGVVDDFLRAELRVPFVRHDLFKRHDNQMVSGADPVVSGGCAAPTVFTDMAGPIPTRNFGAHREAKAKAGARTFFLSEINRERLLRKLIAGHELYRPGAQDAMSVQCSAAFDHRKKTHVISRRTDQSAAAGEKGDFLCVFRFGWSVNHRQPIGPAVIRGEPANFLRWNAASGIG